MVATTDTCPTVDFDILKRSFPFLVDDNVVNLVDSISIWGSLNQFMDVSVVEHGTTYHTPVVKAKFYRLLPTVVYGSTTIPPHCILAPGVITSNFGIQISSYH